MIQLISPCVSCLVITAFRSGILQPVAVPEEAGVIKHLSEELV
jgi:hypothetical protein